MEMFFFQHLSPKKLLTLAIYWIFPGGTTKSKEKLRMIFVPRITYK